MIKLSNPDRLYQ